MVQTDLQQEFYRGKHAVVLEKYFDKAWKEKTQDLPAVIGSLSFLGKLKEAEKLFLDKKSKLKSAELAAARFYLGVGFSRESSYKKGKDYFLLNLKDFRKDKNPLVQFYVAQGIGFYRYLQCRYLPASSWAMRSLVASNSSRFTYGRYLASDLLGYNHVLLGKISEGLKNLEESKTLAIKLGTGSWQQAAQVAITCYEAQFGMKPKTILKEIDALLRILSSDLSYLRSSLLLEKARQLTLRGRLTESDDVLNQAFKIVYASKHKRHGVLLNLRLAENKFLRKDYFGAFNLIRNLHAELDVAVDQQLQIALLGMEKKLCEKLDFPFSSQELDKLTLKSGTGIAKRIQNRTNGALLESHEDHIGDWVEKAASGDEAAVDEIIESGYFGILYALLPLANTPNALIDGLSKKWLLVLEKGNLTAIEKTHSAQLKQLIQLLASGEVSKATLVKNMWGYEYHPLRHDPLLYRAIGRLREYLGVNNHWVEATTHGYRLSPELSITFVNGNGPLKVKSKPQEVESFSLSDTLNYRQIKILQSLKKRDFISMKDVQKLFKVSPITASRDLSQLHACEKILKVGKGRATQYCLPGGKDLIT